MGNRAVSILLPQKAGYRRFRDAEYFKKAYVNKGFGVLSWPECVVAIEPNERGIRADSYEPRHDISHITVEQVFETACKQIKTGY
jgi:hypothetical protein